MLVVNIDNEEGAVSKEPPEPTDSEDARDTTDPDGVTDELVVPDEIAPVDPREVAPVCEVPTGEEPPVEPETETAPLNEERSAEALVDPEVVDTIPGDDDCTG